MEAITFICTVCGAAALSRGIVQLIEHLGRWKIVKPNAKSFL